MEEIKGDHLKTMSYMIACEKIESLIFTLEQTLSFMVEYGIESDEEIKKALVPLLDSFKEWAEK